MSADLGAKPQLENVTEQAIEERVRNTTPDKRRFEYREELAMAHFLVVVQVALSFVNYLQKQKSKICTRQVTKAIGSSHAVDPCPKSCMNHFPS